jgi:hypothetical protein
VSGLGGGGSITHFELLIVAGTHFA